MPEFLWMSLSVTESRIWAQDKPGSLIGKERSVSHNKYLEARRSPHQHDRLPSSPLLYYSQWYCHHQLEENGIKVETDHHIFTSPVHPMCRLRPGEESLAAATAGTAVMLLPSPSVSEARLWKCARGQAASARSAMAIRMALGCFYNVTQSPGVSKLHSPWSRSGSAGLKPC